MRAGPSLGAQESMTDRYRLQLNFRHIGDQIACTAIPENLYNISGARSVITQDWAWAFDHNPYVDHMTEDEAWDLPVISLIPDCRVPEQAQAYYDMMKNVAANGQTEYMCVNMGFNDVRLRHPRLYIYEDLPTEPNKVVVHTQGSDRTRDSEPAIRTSSGEDAERIMTAAVLESIRKNYQGWNIVQVGAADDVPLGVGRDLRGKTDLWGTAREIATAARFIGVNSGPMHMANCYPRVDKRIVLMEFPKHTLMNFRPGDARNWLFSWIDPTNVFFNRFDTDLAWTYSHAKI